jgi:hypothetical protein
MLNSDLEAVLLQLVTTAASAVAHIQGQLGRCPNRQRIVGAKASLWKCGAGKFRFSAGEMIFPKIIGSLGTRLQECSSALF